MEAMGVLMMVVEVVKIGTKVMRLLSVGGYGSFRGGRDSGDRGVSGSHYRL